MKYTFDENELISDDSDLFDSLFEERNHIFQFFLNIFIYSLIIVDAIRKCTASDQVASLVRNVLYIAVLGYVVLHAFKFNKLMVVFGLLFGVGGLYLISLLFYPELKSIITENFILFVIRCIPAFYFLYSVDDWKYTIGRIAKWHWVGLIYCMIVFFFGKDGIENYMTFSYGLLIPGFVALLYGLYEKKKMIVISGIIMFVSILTFGARGPLACIAVAIIFLFIKYPSYEASRGKLFFMIFLACMITVLALFYNEILSFMISKWPNSRTLALLAEGEIGNTSGRTDIYAEVIDGIVDNAFLPAGIFSDRILLSAGNELTDIYPHNFFIEIVYQFGFFGLLFSILYILKHIFVYVYILKNNDLYYKIAFVVFVVTYFIKSLISGSYVSDIQFWLSAGCILGLSRNMNQQIESE